MPDKKPTNEKRAIKSTKKKGKKEKKPVMKSNKREKMPQVRRFVNNKLVIPTMYFGSATGKTNFMAGMVDGKLVEKDGEVLKYSHAGVVKIS